MIHACLYAVSSYFLAEQPAQEDEISHRSAESSVPWPFSTMFVDRKLTPIKRGQEVLGQTHARKVPLVSPFDLH